MPDEENANVEQQAQGEIVAATESDANVKREKPVLDEPSQEEMKKRHSSEYNWAKANRKMEYLERQNEELAKKLQQIEKPAPVDDELDKLGDDDIMTKAQAKKMAERMAREVTDRMIRERDAATVEDRVKAKFTDYDNVVTRDNIELLKQTEPELAQSLASNPDPYAQAVAVYKTMKTLGIGKEENVVDKQKAIKNSQKPMSVNAVTKQSAIGNAHLFENGLTPELKKSLWKEMQDSMKRG